MKFRHLCFESAVARWVELWASGCLVCAMLVTDLGAQTPTAEGLLAHWRFDDTIGSTSVHERINNLSAMLTPTGAAIETGGISGHALRIDRGQFGAAVVGDHLNFTSGAFSISAWIKTTADVQSRDLGIVSKHRLGVLNGYWLGANNSGPGMPNGRATLYSGTESLVTTTLQPVSTTTVNDGQWHHVVATHDPNGMRQMFVDGVPAESTKSGSTNFVTSAPLMIGAYTDFDGVGANLSFEGLIDDVQIYNRALSDNDVEHLRTYPGLAVGELPPPTITSQLRNTFASLGDTVSFSVAATGVAPLVYLWRHNGAVLPGETGAELHLMNLEPADAGTYTVTISNGGASVTSEAARLSLPTGAGLLAHWAFDEVGGTLVAREPVNDLAATLTDNGALIAAGGLVGNALRIIRFSGGAAVVGDHLKFEHEPFTISAWIRTTPNAAGVDLGIVSKHYLNETNGYWLGANNSVGFGGPAQIGKAAFFSGPIGAMSAAHHPVSTTTVNDGQWHHVLATHDPTGVRRIYVDGLPAESERPGTPIIPSDAPLIIGAYALRSGMNLHFDGWIDEVQIYNRVLNDVEMEFLHANPGQSIPATSPPVITGHPQNAFTGWGGTASFGVSVSGAGPFTYEWRRDGVILNGANGGILTLVNIQTPLAGEYTVTVSNAGGSVTSDPARLTVATDIGLLARWPFDDIPGTNVALETVNGLDATLTVTGASIEAGGISGNALRINRVADGAAVVGNHLKFEHESFTISAWIKTITNASALDLGIVSKHYLYEANGYWIGANNSVPFGPNQIGQAALFSGTVGAMSATHHPVSTSIVNDGQWHHVVATHDPNHVRRIYVDGVPAESERPGAPIVASDAPLMIGAYALRGGGQHLHFDGWIDEVQIFDRVLTDAEIGYLFQQPGQAPTQSIVPSIIVQPADQTVLVGQSAQFQVVPANPFGVQYQWFLGPQAIASETNSILPFPTISRAQAGIYSVSLSNPQGAMASRNATLRVLAPQQLHSLLPIESGLFRLVFGDSNGGVISVGDLQGMKVQYSSNLTRASNWITMPMPQLQVVGGQVHLDLTPSNDTPWRFYRVIQD